MAQTLIELYESAYWKQVLFPWRIYGSNSHRLLCEDYGKLRVYSPIEHMKVVNATKKISRNKGIYWRIVVAD